MGGHWVQGGVMGGVLGVTRRVLVHLGMPSGLGEGGGGCCVPTAPPVRPPLCSQLPPPRLQALLGRWRQKVFALLVQLRVQDENQRVLRAQVGPQDPRCVPTHLWGLGTAGRGGGGRQRDNGEPVGSEGS